MIVGKRRKKHHHHSSSSSSSSSEDEKILHELQKIRSNLKSLIKVIQANSPCVPSIPISSLPATGFIASVPNVTYCITTNLTWTGSTPAFTVAADNVTFNSDGFILTLSNPTGTGFSATGVNNLVLNRIDVRSPVISTATSSSGVSLTNCRHVQLDDCYLSQTAFGLNVNSCTDVNVHKSFLVDNGLANINLGGTTGFNLDKSTLTNALATTPSLSGFVIDSSTSLNIKENHLTNSSLFIKGAVGGLFEGNQCVISDPNFGLNVVDIGSTGILSSGIGDLGLHWEYLYPLK